MTQVRTFNENRLPFRIIIGLMLLATIAGAFWLASRYPDLNDKEIMGGTIRLEDPMVFEAVLPIEANMPLWKKIIFSTVNWIETNLKGMTFGILFGAAFLTFLRNLPKRSFKGRFANSALGMAIGAPLGVCVNCAAPIAKGIYSGGARIETALSAMVASPTLNVIVLTMAFSLFPFYLAVMKIGMSLLIILFIVPLICRYLPQDQLTATAQNKDDPAMACPIDVPLHETLGQALSGTFTAYMRDLWFIARTTIPLMLLAGFMGAVIVHLLPKELITDTPFGFLALGAVAIVGTFLPVPISFDVVVAAGLLNGGLHVGFVMTLLFTLGTVSVLSSMVVARMASLRAAVMLAIAVVIVGMIGGYGASIYHDWQSKRALNILTSDAGANDAGANSDFSLFSSAQAAESPIFKNVEINNQTISITRKPNEKRSAPLSIAGAKKPPLFSRIEARELGIDKPLEFSFYDIWPPFWNGRSISTGDIDNDGDPDVVLASSEKGLYIYLNDGKGKFTKKHYDFKKIPDLVMLNAALVDLNNDGWLDLFLSAYRQGSYVLWNKNGEFDEKGLTPVKNREDVIVPIGTSFADFNRDGLLDVALGNWAAGWYRHIPGEEARNRVIFNDKGKLSGEKFLELDGMPGETLTLLASDFNMDGFADILVGNDFIQPDVFYLGDGKGGLKRVRRADGLIELSTETTMAIKTGDLDNDLVPEIYTAQIAGRASGAKQRLKLRPIQLYCNDIKRVEDQEYCLKNMDIHSWYKSGNQFSPALASKCLKLDPLKGEECKAMMVKDLAIQNKDPSICNYIKADQTRARQYCDIHFRETYKPTPEEYADNIPQLKKRNVLLANKNGKFVDITEEKKLGVGGWSWDVKIADFDNDEWQDIYIVNGTWVSQGQTPTNLYYSNKGGKYFRESSKEFGLRDYLLTPVAAKFDMDNDGDLDMITYTTNGPMVAFINNSQKGNSIAFEFRDHKGNRMGIGNKIIIRYGDKAERHQIRELQSGGGFQSFDHQVTHFGLAEYKSVKSIEIDWSTGEKTKIEGPFPANSTYRITRKIKGN